MCHRFALEDNLLNNLGNKNSKTNEWTKTSKCHLVIQQVTEISCSHLARENKSMLCTFGGGFGMPGFNDIVLVGRLLSNLRDLVQKRALGRSRHI